MKLLKFAIAAVFAWALASAPLPAAAQASDYVRGDVIKVDAPASNVTIKHGPLKKFDMDTGMTMVFHVQDVSLIKGVKAGDKVRFVPERINGQFTVTKLEKVK